MTPDQITMTTKIDSAVSEIVKHMALPTADPKIKNQLARYVKSQILALLLNVDTSDTVTVVTLVLNHFNVTTPTV